MKTFAARHEEKRAEIIQKMFPKRGFCYEKTIIDKPLQTCLKILDKVTSIGEVSSLSFYPSAAKVD